MVLWYSNAPDNSLDSIYAQRFSARGVKLGEEVQVTADGFVAGVLALTVLNDGGVW